MCTYSVEAVFHRCIKVIDRIGSTAGIERIAVGKERLASERADHINDSGRIIRTDISHVAGFAEMNLDCRELTFEIDVSNACTPYESF